MRAQVWSEDANAAGVRAKDGEERLAVGAREANQRRPAAARQQVDLVERDEDLFRLNACSCGGRLQVRMPFGSSQWRRRRLVLDGVCRQARLTREFVQRARGGGGWPRGRKQRLVRATQVVRSC